MYELLQIIHVLVALMLIGVVLFQADEGSGLSGAFGTASSPGSQSMFGKKGAAGVMVRFTAVLVTVFMITSFFLTFLVSREIVDKNEVRTNVTQPISQ